MKTFLLTTLAVLFSVIIMAQPITKIGMGEGQTGGEIIVPVTISGMPPITAISLQILYDKNCLQLIGGYSDNYLLFGGGNGVAIIGRHSPFTFEIPDGVFFNLRFKHIKGMSQLKWSDNPAYTEYANLDSVCSSAVFTYENGYSLVTPVTIIGGKTWMAANLNVGTMITGNSSNNGVIEKKCYLNKDTSCSRYGGMYTWGEVMNYYTTPNVQGICPNGWHIPDSADWRTLMVATKGTGVENIDYPVAVGSGRWMNSCGLKLKSVSGWYRNAGNNSSGFNGIPCGDFVAGGNYFENIKTSATYWSSTSMPYNKFSSTFASMTITGAIGYFLYVNDQRLIPYLSDMSNSVYVSVRCVKN